MAATPLEQVNNIFLPAAGGGSAKRQRRYLQFRKNFRGGAGVEEGTKIFRRFQKAIRAVQLCFFFQRWGSGGQPLEFRIGLRTFAQS